MRHRGFLPIFGAAFVLILPAVAMLSVSSPVQGAIEHTHHHAVCSRVGTGFASCDALVVADQKGNPMATSAPTGLAPSTIDSVYGFPGLSTSGSGKTIAIVDAYNDPTAESDLAAFDAQYGLSSCTTANGCFSKVNQSGGANYPQSNSGWALEISLDIQWAHAVAPGAKILLVEAATNNFNDLLTAEDYAKTHAQYVSNSWGGSEFSGENTYDAHFVQSGVSFFVAAGDAGLPAEYPSSSPNVVSVGGTTLNFDKSGAFVSETGWSSGGGCSAIEIANVAQASFVQYGQVGCGGRRATPDVALDADPNSGVAVYDSTPYAGQSGWFKVGGTSAATPMWAGAAAIAGVTVNAAYVYGNSITFRDVTSGNNGASCLIGFDLCSGRGSWLLSSGTTTTTTSTTSTTSTTQPTTTTSPSGPAVPTNLTATSTRIGRISLSWSETTSGVTFNLYRGVGSGNESATPVRTGITSTTLRDSNLTSGTQYCYRVAAVKGSVVSAKSNESCAVAR